VFSRDFESDPDRSTSSKLRHGIDSEEAKTLFDDPRLLEYDTRSQDEPRDVQLG
tara:strand:+ start:1496 stop:1657 length:162 start_codon:yes stop_codon:yes gene_type:complete